jgi:hypothetical protein
METPYVLGTLAFDSDHETQPKVQLVLGDLEILPRVHCCLSDVGVGSESSGATREGILQCRCAGMKQDEDHC